MSEQATETVVIDTPPAPSTEVKVEETPKTEEQKAEELKSQRFADLSKREQKIVQKHQKLALELKQKEADLIRREQEIKDSVRKELRDLARKNPLDAIKELGTDYNAITEYQLGEGKLTPERVATSVNEEIAALREELQKTKLSFEEREQQKKQEENDRILQNFSASIVETVKNSSDKYPAVNAFDGAPVIYEMIQKRWHDTNGQHLMTIDEAAELLEKDLGGLVEKLLQTPKYASRLNPQSKKEDSAKTSLSKPKTITNELTTSAPSMLPPKTENDRIKRALEKLQAS